MSEPRGTAMMEPPKRREMERLEQETKVVIYFPFPSLLA